MSSPQANGVATPPAPTQTSTAALGEPSPPPTQASSTLLDSSNQSSNTYQLPSEPSTSAQDDGKARRPRDARLIHTLLTSLGVQAYEERVPQMLMDFAYRYTSGVLADARDITAETSHGTGRGGGSSAAAAGEGDVSMEALRIAIAAKNHFHIQPRLQKDDLMELANEVNRRQLPVPQREFGLRLPPEKYCVLGVGWGPKPEWEGEEEGDEDEQDEEGGQEDSAMKDIGGEVGAGGEEVDEEEFEDAMGGGGEDSAMKDG